MNRNIFGYWYWSILGYLTVIISIIGLFMGSDRLAVLIGFAFAFTLWNKADMFMLQKEDENGNYKRRR